MNLHADSSMVKVSQSSFEDMEDPEDSADIKEYDIYYDQLEKKWVFKDRHGHDIYRRSPQKNPLLEVARKKLKQTAPSRAFVYTARGSTFNVFEYGLRRNEREASGGEQQLEN